jgi:lipopolysaccharide transport system ATP-binding protein
VEFTRPARRARFGMMIKTTSGVEIGGSTCPGPGAADAEIAAGTRLGVRFTFRCQLFAGMYFINAGVMGEADGIDTYLHRVVDAVAFRVQPDASRKASGYVDFDVRTEVAPVTAAGDGQR